MAWKQVVVRSGKKVYETIFNGSELIIPNEIEIGETLNVNGKELTVLSSVVDYRDNIIKINLANASKPKGEVSDGEQTKG